MARGHGAARIALALTFAIGAAYAVTVNGSFIFDDLHHIVDNPGIRDLSDLGAVLHGGVQETRPVYLLTLALNYAVGGTDVVGYHLVNLMLHFACSMLVYALALALARGMAERGPRWFPEIAAFLFALHPLATESVAYVNSRSGVLAAAFALASIVLYLQYDATRRRRAYAGALACMVLAMGAKESAVVVPVLLVVMLTWFRPGGVRAAAQRWRELLPLGACALLVPLLFWLSENPHADTVGGQTLPLASHWLTQLRVMARLVGLLFYPVAQNFDYDVQPSHGPWDGAVLGAAIVLCAIAAAAFWLRRRAAPVSFGCLWFFVALAPTNPGVPFPNFMAERYLYLPLVGFALGAGWAIAVGLGRASGRVRIVAAIAPCALLVSLGLLTASRNRVLADPLTLWTETARASPNKARPHVNLGILLLARGDEAGGHAHLARAVALDPDDARARYNLGVYYEQRVELAAAVAAVRRAAAAGPARYRSALARVASRHALAERAAGRLESARALLHEAVAAEPAAAPLRYNLARVLLELGEVDPARRQLEETLRLDPEHAKARARLAEILAAPPSRR
jgi:tetratricopeptide (TPR) repeat protein